MKQAHGILNRRHIHKGNIVQDSNYWMSSFYYTLPAVATSA